MRYLSADIIFPMHTPPVKNGVMIVGDNGLIIDLLDPLYHEISKSIQIEKFIGALCPGFINTHCHLELSYLKGKFSTGKGLPVFIGEMIEKRNGNEEEVIAAMADADKELFEGGVVAVGDISNSTASLNQKYNSTIHYHTFVEVFDIFPERAEEVFENGKVLLEKFANRGLAASISPHAAYTVSERLMKLISDTAVHNNEILTIHNQETPGEDEMFEKGTGQLFDKLHTISKAYAKWKPFGKSSLSYVLELLSPEIPLQLIHNTFTSRQDIIYANSFAEKLYWCLCLNANLFIENKLPDIKLLKDQNCTMTIGTDSYASNTSLSVLNELKRIRKFFPYMKTEDLLKWATLNGAEYLRLEKRFGSFEKGKFPGVNLISELDSDFNITDCSQLMRIS
jgi:cytosine/adenosine deaminase-related metal-dependent hydrolase